jgi:hypothetical protein
MNTSIGIRLEVYDQSTGRILDIIQKIDEPAIFRTRRAVYETIDAALIAGNRVIISRVTEAEHD